MGNCTRFLFWPQNYIMCKNSARKINGALKWNLYADGFIDGQPPYNFEFQNINSNYYF